MEKVMAKKPIFRGFFGLFERPKRGLDGRIGISHKKKSYSVEGPLFDRRVNYRF